MPMTTLEATPTASPEPGIPGESRGMFIEWGLNLQAVVCERCDWSYLLPAGSAPPRCPHCFQAGLSVLQAGTQDLPYARPPELVLPFSLTSAALAQAIQEFSGGIPFPPKDLEAQGLRNRLSRLYLPMWLVDAEAQAEWKAEAGFDYQVVSHQDQYNENGGGWSSRQVQEGRIRWEARLGRLERSYQNIAAPALEEDRALKAALGAFDLSAARPFQAEVLKGAFVRLPNRTPQDAWPEAQPALKGAAAEECRQAAGADHIRSFAWQPRFAGQNWTLLLLPILTTYYLDDQKKPQPVLIHGQSGKLSGVRRSSMKSAQRASLNLLVGAGLVFLLSLLLWAGSLLMPMVFVAGVIGMLIAIFLAAGAVIPPIMSWWFNRSQV